MRRGHIFRKHSWFLPLAERVRRAGQDEMDECVSSKVDAELDELVGVATRMKLTPSLTRDVLLILPEVPRAAFLQSTPVRRAAR